jgi:hypothetical protein
MQLTVSVLNATPCTSVVVPSRLTEPNFSAGTACPAFTHRVTSAIGAPGAGSRGDAEVGAVGLGAGRDVPGVIAVSGGGAGTAAPFISCEHPATSADAMSTTAIRMRQG